MIELSKEQIKKDPVFLKMLKAIIRNHTVAEHTKKTLLENRQVKDFCENARQFAVLGDDIYIHYDTRTWFQGEGDMISFPVSIRSVVIYDNALEYNNARRSQLDYADQKEQPSSDLN